MPVSNGGRAMRLLEQRGGVKAVETNEIQRQKSTYKQVVADIAKGNLGSGFEQLDDLGWIVELEDEQRLDRIAKDYADSIAKGMSTLVVSPTNLESSITTTAIRDELKMRAMIGKDETSFVRLRPKHLTAAERRDAAFLEAGDVIVFQQNAKGHKKGERIQVGDAMPSELLELADRFAVYRPEKLQLSSGDRLRFTANGKTKDRKHRLNNGSIYRN